MTPHERVLAAATGLTNQTKTGMMLRNPKD
jgi:hypothetical protein